MKKNKSLLKKSYKWHRIIGTIAAIPIIFISISGILLNHSHFFSLDKIFLNNSLLLNFYGMEPEEKPLGFKVSKNWISSFEGNIYLNDKELIHTSSPIVSADKLKKILLAADRNFLYIIDPRKKIIIEKLGSESLPKGEILGLKVLDVTGDKTANEDINNIVLLDTSEGTFSSNIKLSEFTKRNKSNIKQSKPSILPKMIEQKIIKSWRGQGLSLWQVVQNLHSGAILGFGGKLMWDIFAGCLLLLVISGLYQRK